MNATESLEAVSLTDSAALVNLPECAEKSADAAFGKQRHNIAQMQETGRADFRVVHGVGIYCSSFVAAINVSAKRLLSAKPALLYYQHNQFKFVIFIFFVPCFFLFRFFLF